MKYLLFFVLSIATTGSLFSQDEKRSDVPFAVIERVPIYSGCEELQGDNAALKKCMSTKIQELVASNFNVGSAQDIGLKGVQQIYAQFRINKKGQLDSIKVRAPHTSLDIETKRVLALIPDMIPGEHRGLPVGVLYALPIRFQIEANETPKEMRRRIREERKTAKNKN